MAIWDKGVFGHIPRRIAWLFKRLKRLRCMGQTLGVLEETRQVEKELSELRRRQETSAWQRCRPFVLRDENRNTSFFHAKASNRRRLNRIVKLQDTQGTVQEEPTQIENIVLQYFEYIFTSSAPCIHEQDVEMIERCVTDEMQEGWGKSFAKEEVLSALHNMHPCKSPGPDGMPALFYQRF